MSEAEAPKPRPGSRRLFYLLPLGFFISLALIFLIRLESDRNPEHIPSVLIDRPAPNTPLPPLEGVDLPGLERADLEGEVSVVNIFASWCGPCRVEHPIVEALGADDRIRVIGINYKDKSANARAWLEELGNPYDIIGVDERGRMSIEWGVYGVPETFVVDAKGIVRLKHIGPLSPTALQERVMPAIEEALTAAE